MKNLLYIVFIILAFPLHSQWTTVKGEYIHNFPPVNQFTIDPFTNSIWLVDKFKATVIEADGLLTTFGENELGPRWGSDKLNFGFTPGHTYFTKQMEGLYLFDNYQKQLLLTDNNFFKIYNDIDTLFITRDNDKIIKYTFNMGIENTTINAKLCAPKNGELYINIGQYAYIENGTFSLLYGNPYYLGGTSNVMEFESESDTIYLGFINGITKCYGGSCFDTITPFNTTNMPSPNILEIEFDSNNNLWVAFGDVNDEYIALGKLEGSTWTEVYTESNSPINFDRFYGFEFDTLGNIWVASDMDLHTIVNINSPGWLSNQEHVMESPRLSVYPNPADDILFVQLPQSVSKAEISISDINRKVVKTQTLNSNEVVQLNIRKLESGIYILHVISDEMQWKERLVKR
jgi:hypothetical protein